METGSTRSPLRVPHGRRSLRLRGFDYTRPGIYFITAITHLHHPLFSEIRGGLVHPSPLGDIVGGAWRALPDHFPHVAVHDFVTMPDHVHGLISIDEGGGARTLESHGRSPGVPPGSLGAIIRSFKSAATKRINEFRDTPGTPVWQRNYHDRIVRDERELREVQRYIAENPSRWRNRAAGV